MAEERHGAGPPTVRIATRFGEPAAPVLQLGHSLIRAVFFFFFITLKERETTGFEPSALHAPRQWAIEGGVIKSRGRSR